MCYIIFGTISHPQERMTVNHDATGSSPVTGATKSHNQAVCGIFYFSISTFSASASTFSFSIFALISNI